MNETTARRQAGEARALLAILTIAKQAAWSLDNPGPALSSGFANYLYCADSELLLVPSVAELDWQLRRTNSAMREARSDAIIVTVGPRFDELRFAVGLWTLARNLWAAPAWPWADRNGLWLGCDELPGEAFPIRQGRLRREPAPWANDAEKTRGRIKADAWLARTLAGPVINNSERK